MEAQAPPPARPRRRGKKRHGWGCYEWCQLKAESLFGLALMLVLFVGDLVQDPDLAQVLKSQGVKYTVCYSLVVALRAYILKHQNNVGKSN